MTNNTAARKAGLTSIHQIEAVRILAAGPETMTTVDARLEISTAGVTHIADKLEKLELVQRVRGSHDRRAVWLKLTEKGQSVAARLSMPEPAAA